MIIERLAKDVLGDRYFLDLFMKLSKHIGNHILKENFEDTITQKELSHLLRFGDILSNSREPEARNIAYKIISLLNTMYNNDPIYQSYSKAILSKLGNFPAINYLNYDVELPYDRKLEILLKQALQKVNGTSDIYFTDAQYELFVRLQESDFYSFAGPTSMGKSFIIKAFIQEILQTTSVALM